MDNYVVLMKFYQVSEQMRNYRLEKMKNEKPEKSKDRPERLSHSNKNIIGIVYENKVINQRTIAKFMNISSQAVSENVKKLEQLGIIEKSLGVQNNENLIKLTDKGESLAVIFDKNIKEHANDVFKDFTDEEMENLYNLLEKLL